MATGLGLSIGTVNSTAVMHTDGTDPTDPPAGLAVSHATTLKINGTDRPELGATAGDGTVVTDFATRVGDPVPLIADDGTQYSAEDLVATAMHCLVAEATASAHEDAVPATVATYPAVYTDFAVDALRGALDEIGLASVGLISEPAAAAAWLEADRGPLDDTQILVYDLGGSALDVAVIRTGAGAGSHSIVGTPLRSEEFGGTQLDQLVLGYVVAGLTAQFGHLDLAAPEAVAALTALRAQCTFAKETLSAQTEAVIPVDLPGVRTEGRIVRAEFEDLARGPLTASLDLVHECLRTAGVAAADLSGVLLIGGSAAIPLLTELIADHLQLPVIVGPVPATVAAQGAATLGAARAAAERAALAAASGAGAAGPAAAAAEAAAAVPLVPAAPKMLRLPPAVWWKRRAVLIGVAAAAVVVLSAGGLSFGTGLYPSVFKPTTDTVHVTPAGSTSDTGHAGTTTGTDTVAGTHGAAAPGTAANPTGAAVPGRPGTTATAGQPGAVPGAGNAASPGTAPAPGTPGQLPPAPAPGTGLGNAANGVGTGAGQLANGLGQGAGQAANGVGSGVGQAADGAGNAVGNAANGVGTGAGNAVNGVGSGLGGATSGLGAGAGQAANGVGTGAGQVANGVGQGLGGVVGGVGQGLGGVVGGVGQGVGGVLGGLTGTK